MNAVLAFESVPAKPASKGVAVRLHGVSKTFGSPDAKAGAGYTALHALDATFAPGRVTGLVGPDGSGKTTLMRMIAGLLVPSSGSIEMVEGERVLGDYEAKAGLGYMPQRFGLYEDLSVEENLVLNAELRGVPAAKRGPRFEQVLAFTDLHRFTGRHAGKLSGGMKQKLGLACALIAEPAVLLLDEPSVGVDPISRRELWAMVRALAGEGMTVIWSTAYLDEAERCDDVIVMNGGQILYQGQPAQFASRCNGRVFLIEQPAHAKRAALKRFSRDAGTVDAIIQGDRLRVVMKADSKRVDAGNTPDVPLADLAVAAPRFEDAFIDALGGAGKEESVIARVAQMRAPVSGDVSVIEAHDLTKRFGEFTATDHVNFSVRQGEVFGLLGPNGAGKSTTFKMLCGLMKPTSGSARVMGIDLGTRASQGKQRLGYMAQKFSMYEGLSVGQNLEFYAGIYGLSGARQRERVGVMTEAFGLAQYLERSPKDIPLGYKQRLALACALMHEPDILFLDEPTSGVDPITRREFWAHINAMVERKVTVLVTTHFMEEAEYCDRIGLVDRGRVIALGTPDELKRRAATSALPNPSMEEAFIRLVEDTRS
jgi:ABC-2 type transport system ATP-binding protein